MRLSTARFWDWINDGPVRLTLRVGQRLGWSRGGSTDEGWERETVTWEYDRETGKIHRTGILDGSDCDGRLTVANVTRVALANLYAGAVNVPGGRDGIRYPGWEEGTGWRRDLYAEAMGY